MNFDYNFLPGFEYESNDLMIESTKKNISVIVVFNDDSKYFENTILSILNQTYPFFELIIVNISKTIKKSNKTLSKYESKDRRIKIYDLKTDNINKARNFGTTKVSLSSKYLCFIDSGNLISKTYLNSLYWSLETNKEASWAFSNIVNFGSLNTLSTIYFSVKKEKVRNLLKLTALIRKDAFNYVKGFEEKASEKASIWNLCLKLLENYYFPVHTSGFDFYYRREKNNKKKEISKEEKEKYINTVASKIDNKISSINYPKYDANWDTLCDSINIDIPKTTSTKKEILFIIPWMIMGGADRFNLDLIQRLDKNKYHFTVISTLPSINSWQQEFTKDADVYDLTSFIDQKYWQAFINYIIESKNIKMVLVSNSTYGYSIIPYIKARYSKIPIIDYIHIEEWYNRNGGFSRDSAMVHSLIDKTLFCNKNSERIMHEYFKIPSNEIDTVYIGVDENLHKKHNINISEVKQKYNIPLDKKIINFMARIDVQKRPMLFMNIVKKYVANHNDVYFIVVGDGAMLPKMKDYAKKYNLNKYIGFLGPSNKVDEIYEISDITFNCSIKEGVALTSYESLAMDVPVITPDVGGQAELVNSTVGYVVKCLQKEQDIRVFKYSDKEVDQYIEAIEYILSNEASYKGKCRDRILKSFTINHMVINMDKIMSEIIENPNKIKVENGKNLRTNIDITKDRINYYFEAFKADYIWAAKNFNENVVMLDKDWTFFAADQTEFRRNAKILAKKMHIYKPIASVMNVGRAIKYRVTLKQ